MIVTKKCLNRRTFLRGAGAAVALPFLDAMRPAFAASSAPVVKRLAVAYVPNGIIMNHWTPTAEGTAFEFPAILQPLAPFRDQVLILSGLDSRPAFPAPGEGTGDHARASATFLTGVHPKKTEGPDLRAGISMDQVAAAEMGKDTQLASLEMCLESSDLIGGCDAGYSCAYANTLSWRNPTTPLPMENQPRAVFERLFGDSDDTGKAARLARIRQEKSILDSLLQEVSAMKRGLGPDDRNKLAQYLDATRDLERRIQKAEEQSSKELPVVARPTGGIPATFEEHARMMFDLEALAFQADLTRVATFMISREISPRSYPEIGISDAHHALTHESRPESVAKVVKINTYHIQQFAYFLEKLKSTPDGDGTLLDHVAIVYGGGISNGFEHTHTQLPVLVAGGAAGLGHGHIRFREDLPLANLHLTLLENVGVPMERFGDSNGALPRISLA